MRCIERSTANCQLWNIFFGTMRTLKRIQFPGKIVLIKGFSGFRNVKPLYWNDKVDKADKVVCSRVVM